MNTFMQHLVNIGLEYSLVFLWDFSFNKDIMGIYLNIAMCKN